MTDVAIPANKVALSENTVVNPTDIPDAQGAEHLDHWLSAHHTEYTPDDGSGEVYHVFVSVGNPVYGDYTTARKDFDISIPIGPVIFIIKGYIDVSNLEIDAEFSVKVPILGTFRLGRVKGNLEQGVEIGFKLPMLQGSARFFVESRYFKVELKVTVFGKSYSVVIPLFPLPGVYYI